MENSIVGLICIIVGLGLVIFHKTFAYKSIMSQNKFGFHFGNREIRGASVYSIIGGLLLMIVGLLTMFKLISFK
jgi:hypothetical protein